MAYADESPKCAMRAEEIALVRRPDALVSCQALLRCLILLHHRIDREAPCMLR